MSASFPFAETRGTWRAAFGAVLSTWLASAQRATHRMPGRSRWVLAAMIVLAHSATAHAQLGRALDDPRPTAELARSLGDPSVRAAREPEPDAARGDGWAFDLSAVTSLPLSVGVRADLSTPLGITGQLSIGHTPSAYLGAVASALESAGAFGSQVEGAVTEGIANGAWNVRAGVGFTFAQGFEISVGYTFITLNAPLTAQSIEAATGASLHGEAVSAIPLGIDLHAIHARIGGRFLIGDHVVLRIALGWTHVLAASAHLGVPADLRRLDGPVERMELGITSAMSRFGFTPELILAAGYRF